MTGLVYIVGSGRSGSTVIERVLHSAPRVVGVGEMHALWRLPLADLLCACGSRVPNCHFWREALEMSRIGPGEIARLAQLEREVVRNRYLLKLGFDLERIRGDDRLSEFGELQMRLLQAVREAGQGDVVLDSSKAGPRAWVLAAMAEPLILHVYRGAQEVLASWRRPKFEPATGSAMKKPSLQTAAMDWIKAEQAARGLSRVADVSRVDYTAFATDPKAALSTALNQRKPGLVDQIDWVGARAVRPATQYHSVLGNPDRFDASLIEIAPQHAADRSRFGWFEGGAIRAVGKTLELAFP